MTSLDGWIDKEARLAASAMLRAISATDIVKVRPGFGQRIVPRPGSVVASPVLADYDPDPDYFFHWFRDSAIVIDALRAAPADGLDKRTAVERLRAFVAFSRSLRSLDGRELLREGRSQEKTQPSFLQYVRPEDEIGAVFGDAVEAEARVNPDGTLDFTRWARPQNDGPALRILALTRWRDADADLDETLRAAMQELVISDLDFIRSRVGDSSFDIWEEERGYHYYTQLAQAEALVRGAGSLDEAAATRARACRSVAEDLASKLDAYWSTTDRFYRSRIGGSPQKALDISVVLGVLHAGRANGAHSVLDPRAQATLSALEDLFDAEYAINYERPLDHGPAMGRYATDGYFGGNPWYLATLAAAEFYFKLAIAIQLGAEMTATSDNARFRRRLSAAGDSPAAAAVARGDGFMRTVRTYAPASGDLSEQFDRATGAQTSAKHLAWSYAALITAAESRRRAVQAIRG